jgi:hypothetical protein
MKKKRKPEAIFVSAKDVCLEASSEKIAYVCVCVVNGLQDVVTKHEE